jgi:hypothetical protein
LPGALTTPAVRDNLGTLGDLMSQPLPDRTKVKKEAQASADWLKAWLSFNREPRASAPAPARPANLFLKVIGHDRTLFPKAGHAVTVASWDVAAQMALALQAQLAGRASDGRKIDDPEAAKALRELFRLLQFSKNGMFDSPVEFEGKAVRQQIEDVCNRLEKAAPGR